MKTTISCVGILVGAVLAVVMGLFAVASIANGVGQWQLASAQKVESEQMTKRVDIQESGLTERAKIEWNARVKIARWDSRGEIGSSWPGLFSHIFNVVVGVLAIVAATGGAFLWMLRQKDWR